MSMWPLTPNPHPSPPLHRLIFNITVATACCGPTLHLANPRASFTQESTRLVSFSRKILYLVPEFVVIAASVMTLSETCHTRLLYRERR